MDELAVGSGAVLDSVAEALGAGTGGDAGAGLVVAAGDGLVVATGDGVPVNAAGGDAAPDAVGDATSLPAVEVGVGGGVPRAAGAPLDDEGMGEGSGDGPGPASVEPLGVMRTFA